jgi:hypothetical protein
MISVWEPKRRAPLHFESLAENAKYCARLLSRAPHSTATYQGFVREASLSLELIAKAVIAQRLEAGEDLGAVTRVPASHNVPHLWATARLPSLPPDDYGRLVHARVYLMWAGRYPAPLRDEDGERDIADLWDHANERVSDSTLFRKPHSFNYEDIDRIFSVAHHCFWDLRNAHGS